MSAKTDARKGFSPFFLPVQPGSPYFTRVSGFFDFLHFCKWLQKDGCFSLFLAWKKCSFGRARIKKSLENSVFSRLFWRKRWDFRCLHLFAFARCLVGFPPLRGSLLVQIPPAKNTGNGKSVPCIFGGSGGIRTHEPLRAT